MWYAPSFHLSHVSILVAFTPEYPPAGVPPALSTLHPPMQAFSLSRTHVKCKTQSTSDHSHLRSHMHPSHLLNVSYLLIHKLVSLLLPATPLTHHKAPPLSTLMHAYPQTEQLSQILDTLFFTLHMHPSHPLFGVHICITTCSCPPCSQHTSSPPHSFFPLHVMHAHPKIVKLSQILLKLICTFTCLHPILPMACTPVEPPAGITPATQQVSHLLSATGSTHLSSLPLPAHECMHKNPHLKAQLAPLASKRSPFRRKDSERNSECDG